MSQGPGRTSPPRRWSGQGQRTPLPRGVTQPPRNPPGGPTVPAPNDLEAERAILGSVLLGGDLALSRALEFVKADDFAHPGYKIIFAAMCALAKLKVPIDTVTLSTQLRASNDLDEAGGLKTIVALGAVVPTAANAGHYGKIVHDVARIRKATEVGRRLAEAGMTVKDADAFIRQAQTDILALTATEESRLMRASEWAPLHYKTLEDRHQAAAAPHLFTGLYFWDEMALLKRSELAILAGRPGSGKSSSGLCIALGAALRGLHVVLVEVEMSTEMTADRLTSEAAARIDIAPSGPVDTRLLERAHRMNANDWLSAQCALKAISQTELDLWVVSRINVYEMTARLLQEHRIRPIDLVVVDYLQLVDGEDSESNERELASISRELKAFAKTTNSAVLALSQLNRECEKRDPPIPIMSDIRGSGAIEQDAHTIVFLYRPFYYDDTADPGDAEFHVGKNRSGPIGKFHMRWDAPNQRFYDP